MNQISADATVVYADRPDIPWHSEIYITENAVMAPLNDIITHANQC